MRHQTVSKGKLRSGFAYFAANIALAISTNNTFHNVAQPIIGAKSARSVSKMAGKSQVSLQIPPVKTTAPTIVQRLTIDEGGAGQRLDNFLIKVLKGAPKTLVYRIIRSGEVRVNKGRASADTRLTLGDEVRVPPLRLAEKDEAKVAAIPAREFPILFEDEFFIAINKPAGVAVHGGSGVSHGVIEQLRKARPQARFLELVHRLDKETSGILLVAKKRSALVTLQDFFRNRLAHKTYAALVVGSWPGHKKVIDVALHKFLTHEGERRVKAVAQDDDDGRRSISLVQVVQKFEHFTLLDVTIKTGRTHQIRVHVSHEGYPIVGDEKYGDFALNKALSRGEAVVGVNAHRLDGGRCSRMFLHARYLRLPHPVTGVDVVLEASIPSDCQVLLNALTPVTS